MQPLRGQLTEYSHGRSNLLISIFIFACLPMGKVANRHYHFSLLDKVLRIIYKIFRVSSGTGTDRLIETNSGLVDSTDNMGYVLTVLGFEIS